MTETAEESLDGVRKCVYFLFIRWFIYNEEYNGRL